MAKVARVSKAFATALARPVLNRLATIPIFQQGQELFLHGHCHGLELDADEAAAEVRDGEPFLSRLWMEDGFLQYDCPCERGKQGFLCAHGVAVALAALEGKPAAGKPAVKAKRKTIDLAQTDKILREQSTETLAGLLLGWAQRDERLLHHLMSFAAQQGGFALDLKAYRASLKKRLKKPRLGSTAADYRRYSEAVEFELDQIANLVENGQAYAALELASDMVMLLLKFDQYGGATAYEVMEALPRALNTFLLAARRTHAEPKVLIPHLLQFHQNNLEQELKEVEPDGTDELAVGSVEAQEALAELLGDAGLRQLAAAAEALVEPSPANWEKRTASLRMRHLAENTYLALGDYAGVERLLFDAGQEDYHHLLEVVTDLLDAKQPQAALTFLDRAKNTFRRTAPPEATWLRAEAHVRLGDSAAAFAGCFPILEAHRPDDLKSLHHFAVSHQCWPQWREFLLADKPPGNPAAEHRHHWRFQVHMFEKNYDAAWPLAVWHVMDPALAAECALEMRAKDPAEAARVLAEAAEQLLKDDRYVKPAIAYLDVAAQLVVDQNVRPEKLSAILIATQRRFAIYGTAHLVKAHEFLWNKAVFLLNGYTPAKR